MRSVEPTLVTCPMCGHSFDPAGRRACSACPLQNGCQMVCCPQCGYELVDVSQSRLAQIAAKLLFRKESRSPGSPLGGLPSRQTRPGD